MAFYRVVHFNGHPAYVHECFSVSGWSLSSDYGQVILQVVIDILSVSLIWFPRRSSYSKCFNPFMKVFEIICFNNITSPINCIPLNLLIGPAFPACSTYIRTIEYHYVLVVITAVSTNIVRITSVYSGNGGLNSNYFIQESIDLESLPVCLTLYVFLLFTSASIVFLFAWVVTVTSDIYFNTFRCKICERLLPPIYLRIFTAAWLFMWMNRLPGTVHGENFY